MKTTVALMVPTDSGFVRTIRSPFDEDASALATTLLATHALNGTIMVNGDEMRVVGYTTHIRYTLGQQFENIDIQFSARRVE